MSRPLAFAGLLGLVLMLKGLGVLVGYAQQQVTNSEVRVSVRAGASVDPDVLQQAKRGSMTGAIMVSLSTGMPVRPQHWTDFFTDANGQYSYESDHGPTNPFLPQTPVPRFIATVALPFAAGLGIVIGTLFIVAARWSPHTADLDCH